MFTDETGKLKKVVSIDEGSIQVIESPIKERKKTHQFFDGEVKKLENIPEQLKKTPLHRLNRKEMEEKRKNLSEKHKIKTSKDIHGDRREIKVREQTPEEFESRNQWLTKLQNTISDPEKVSDLMNYFDSIIQNSDDEWYKQFWTQQKDLMDQTDETIDHEIEAIDKIIANSDILKGLEIFIIQFKGLMERLSAFEQFYEMEVGRIDYDTLYGLHSESMANIQIALDKLTEATDKIVIAKREAELKEEA